MVAGVTIIKRHRIVKFNGIDSPPPFISILDYNILYTRYIIWNIKVVYLKSMKIISQTRKWNFCHPFYLMHAHDSMLYYIVLGHY